MDWKPYAVSLGIGIIVGVAYALLNTRSPAPPVIALLGLLGMLAGETVMSWAKNRMNATEAMNHCLKDKTFAARHPHKEETKA